MPDIRSIIIYALLAVLALVGLRACHLTVQRDSARKEAKVSDGARQAAETALENLQQAQVSIKQLADARYNTLKTAADQLTVQLQQAYDNQESIDATRKLETQRAAKQLAALRTELGRLRDPFQAAPAPGRGSGGGRAEGQATSPTVAGAGDAAGSQGLLSPGLSAFLAERLPRAEALNDAYTSCRKALLDPETQL